MKILAILNIEGMIVAVLLGLISAVCAYTISKRRLFKPLRLWAKEKSDTLYDLLSCHWCLSFWMALFWNIVFFPGPFILADYPFFAEILLEFFASWFFIASIATFILSTAFDRYVHVHVEPERYTAQVSSPDIFLRRKGIRQDDKNS